MDKKQVVWINCAKLIAILAVMTDHVYSILAPGASFQYVTWFSVSLFILLSGMTAFMTGDKLEGMSWLRSFWSKSRKILTAYLAAVLVYELIAVRSFDLLSYLNLLVHFNASGPLYFVALYLQLMLLCKPLFMLIKKMPAGRKGIFAEILVGGIIVAGSVFTTNYTNILDIYGGGGKLFGGTYLILFYLGMLAAKHRWFFSSDCKKAAICLGCAGPAMLLWAFFIGHDRLNIDLFLPFGAGLNPPGLSLMVMAFLVLVVCYGFFTLLGLCTPGRKLTMAAGALGRHTLYLFLYHRLFLDVVNSLLGSSFPVPGKVVLFYAAMFAGPIVVEFLLKKLSAGWKVLTEKRGV